MKAEATSPLKRSMATKLVLKVATMLTSMTPMVADFLHHTHGFHKPANSKT